MSDPSDDPPGRSPRSRRRTPPSATQQALGLLVRREHSRRELQLKLTARGHDRADAEAAVERLAQAGWQDDARFAESLVRSRAAAGYGPVRIRAELAAHGVDRDAIAAALDAFDGDWNRLARDLIRRRFGPAGPADDAARRKGAELLLRRGFPRDVAFRSAAYDGEGDPDA